MSEQFDVKPLTLPLRGARVIPLLLQHPKCAHAHVAATCAGHVVLSLRAGAAIVAFDAVPPRAAGISSGDGTTGMLSAEDERQLFMAAVRTDDCCRCSCCCSWCCSCSRSYSCCCS